MKNRHYGAAIENKLVLQKSQTINTTSPKTISMVTTQFIGIKNLTDKEQELVKATSASYLDKVDRALPNLEEITIQIKEHSAAKKPEADETKRKKFSIKIKAAFGKKVLETSSFGWDLHKVLHKTFKEMETHIAHTLRNETSYKKPYA